VSPPPADYLYCSTGAVLSQRELFVPARRKHATKMKDGIFCMVVLRVFWAKVPAEWLNGD